MRRLMLCAVLALLAPVSQAQDLNISNPSFEDDFAADGTFPVLVPNNWSLYDPNGIHDGNLDAVGVVNPTGTTFFPGGVPDGRNAALVFVSGDVGGGPIGLVQEIDYSLQVGNTYTLRVAVGNIASGSGSPPNTNFFNLEGFPGYAVQLLAGGVVVAEDNNSLAGSIPEGTFAESVVSISVDERHPQLNATLAIRLLNLTQPGTALAPGIEVDFDNVRLSVAPTVPEPRTYALIAGGLLLVMLGARRRAARQLVPVRSDGPRGRR